MTLDRANRQYPDLAEFTAHVASLHGLERVVDVGLAWTPEIAIVYPEIRVTGVALPDQAVGKRSRYPFRGVIQPEDLANSLALSDRAGSALLVTGPHGPLRGPEGILQRLARTVPNTSLLVVGTDQAELVVDQLATAGLRPEFVGRTRATDQDDDRSAHLIVYDSVLAQARAESSHAPDGFRVVAIMTVFNEEDVIGPAIEKLIGDGVGVYVIDNWSTDRSKQIARGFEGRGLVGLERFPDAPSDRFVLQALLRRVAAVAAGLQADWFIHHDADERRCGPWPDLGLRDALWRVDRAGFSAIDHTVANYRPVDNAFVPGSDFERHMHHFEFGRTSDLLLQIKAWKNVGEVDLATRAGHEVLFPGRRVFPYKFLLKHYPIRSQSHGERKVLRDRVPRWDPDERALGWHNHYDDFGSSQSNPSFLRDPSELIDDRGAETRVLYLPEMLTGTGLTMRGLPGWALGGIVRRTIYFRSRPVTRSRAYQRLRRVVLAPRGLSRRIQRARSGGT
jgi:glycosyltransferase involved in cell wall biosynthesis